MPTVDYIAQNKPEILTQLCYGYGRERLRVLHSQRLSPCTFVVLFFQCKRISIIQHTLSPPPKLNPSSSRYKDSTIALSTGMMLRECIKQESLAKIILYSDVSCAAAGVDVRLVLIDMPLNTRHVFFFPHQELFDEFFDYVQNSQFDVAADAFSTFRVSWGQPRAGLLRAPLFEKKRQCQPPFLKNVLSTSTGSAHEEQDHLLKVSRGEI